MSRFVGLRDVVWLLLATLWLFLFLSGIPETFIWYESLRDWAEAWRIVVDEGRLPTRGPDISGVGFNGPLVYLIYGLALSLVFSEWTLPVVSSAAVVASVVTVLAMLRRSRPWLAVLPVVLLVVSHPLLFEWSRAGQDFSFALVAAAVCVAFVLRVPGPDAWPGWLVWAFTLAVVSQIHIALLPAVAVWGLWHWWPRRTWRNALAATLGVLVPFLPLLLDASSRPGNFPAWDGVPEVFGVWWHLLLAEPRAWWARREVLGPWALVGGGVAALWWCFLVAVALRSRRHPGQRPLWAGLLLSWLLLSFPESWHYHHLIHMLPVWILGTVLIGWTFSARPAGRSLLAVLVCLQLLLSWQLQQHTRRTGLLPMANLFPASFPGELQWSASLRFRTALDEALSGLGAGTPWQRRQLLRRSEGLLPLVEYRWLTLADMVSATPGEVRGPGEDSSGPWRLDSCAASTPQAPVVQLRGYPGHCLVPDTGILTEGVHFHASTPWAGQTTSPADAAFDWEEAYAAAWQQARWLPGALLQVLPVQVGPVRLESAEPFAHLVLRGVHFPIARQQGWTADFRVFGPEGQLRPERTIQSYTLRELHFRFAVPTTMVELQAGAPDARWIALDFDLFRAEPEED